MGVRVKALQRFGTFLQEVRDELMHVSWPTRDELVGSVTVVFVGVTLLAIFISAWDFVLSKLAQVLLR